MQLHICTFIERIEIQLKSWKTKKSCYIKKLKLVQWVYNNENDRDEIQKKCKNYNYKNTAGLIVAGSLNPIKSLITSKKIGKPCQTMWFTQILLRVASSALEGTGLVPGHRRVSEVYRISRAVCQLEIGLSKSNCCSRSQFVLWTVPGSAGFPTGLVSLRNGTPIRTAPAFTNWPYGSWIRKEHGEHRKKISFGIARKSRWGKTLDLRQPFKLVVWRNV
jgi:hypothetical protein